jgi:ATP-binding cassette subfamily C (CFTR/MRP) protein 1
VLKIVQCEVDVGAEGVAYSAQQTELFSGTVRDNIVFGQRYSLDVYSEVLVACALDVDLATMPAGDHTEITQGGGTLSGGQRARIGLARAVYAANICLQDNRRSVPLVLLDDPLASVDRRVANHISERLFGQAGLLMRCAVVVTSADPWWLARLQMGLPCKMAVLREGRIAGYGGWSDLRQLEEIQNASPADDEGTSLADSGPVGPPDNPQDEVAGNEQDGDEEQTTPWSPRGHSDNAPLKQPDSVVVTQEPRVKDKYAQTEAVEELMEKGRLVEEEHREVGFVKWPTYNYYLRSVGYLAVTLIFWAIVGIMIFQQCTTLWLSYWVEEHKETHFLHPYIMVWPGPQHQMGYLQIYAILIFFFVVFNFTGHFLEVIGGIGAARTIFRDALVGTFAKPIQWWDVNPTGRVLNRFSEDVETMDLAITNILGVILGAVLYFVGHVTFLAMANPYSLILLPFIIIAFQWISKYYRTTIRELHRMWLVGMSSIYQDMVEAICCRVTIRAFDRTVGAICANIAGLDHLQRLMFTKEAVKCWISLRLQLIGWTLTIFNTIYPILQFFGVVGPQSAALVGFSIQYSSAVNAIIQQLIFNFSDLEMQLVSIERLREYSLIEQQRIAKDQPAIRSGHRGIRLENICVTYRDGLKPALTDVSLDFAPKEIVALVGRTGAGKSSLLLSILQLVYYEGKMWLDGVLLADCDGDAVRQNKIGIVPQSPVLFAGDVQLNLDPENLKSDDEKFDVLRKVGLQSAILAGSAGLATKLATDSEGIGREGLQLSQGQKQLLCAARVLLRKPRVVLLDEVTSCLGADIGAEILTTLIGEFSAINSTVILVTHKDDQRKFCNRVVTIEAGRIKSDRRVATEEEP